MARFNKTTVKQRKAGIMAYLKKLDGKDSYQLRRELADVANVEGTNPPEIHKVVTALIRIKLNNAFPEIELT
jgi:NADH:ubiquinone oxidoreductase subunit E